MKNFLKTLTMLTLAGLAVACQNQNSQEQVALEGSKYQGIIPCADCPGIALTVSLQDDGQFKTSSMYIGESSRKFIEKGLWEVKDDTLLVLNGDSETPRLFDINSSSLTMLQADGKAVTGQLATHFILHKADSTKIDKNIWQDERDKGIDFHATGNEPFWAVSIDFEGSMLFQTMEGDTVEVPVPEMKADEQSKARVFKAKAESDSIVVSLFPVGCVDSMSGWVFDYFVRAKIGDKQYEGCGDFINPDYNINEIWALYSLNGNKIEKENIKFTLPYLQFSVAKQKVYGNTGCNLLSGSFSIQDSSISFSKMATTKRACMDENLEQPFLKALNAVNNFELANGELIFLNQSDTLMVFRKAE